MKKREKGSEERWGKGTKEKREEIKLGVEGRGEKIGERGGNGVSERGGRTRCKYGTEERKDMGTKEQRAGEEGKEIKIREEKEEE